MPMSRSSSCLVLLVATLALACQPIDADDSSVVETSGDGDGDSGDGDPGDGDPTTGTDTGGATFNCDPSEAMPCPEGQKCTALTAGGGPPVYDCVPDDGSLLPNEPCTPAPNSGQDQCPSGFVCMPSEPDGMSGVCLELCATDTDCDAAFCTTPPDQQVPVCGAICDPLTPLCPDLQTCQRIRGSNFACVFPREGDVGTTADGCDSVTDSGCAQGFVCETGGIIPGCADPSCCTALCDLSDVDPCMSPMLCGEIPLDPQPGLESVGACYVPQ